MLAAALGTNGKDGDDGASRRIRGPQCTGSTAPNAVLPDGASALLVLRLISPSLSSRDLAALRLVNRDLCDAASQVVATIHCTPNSSVPWLMRSVALAFPVADTLVLDFTSLKMTQPPPLEADIGPGTRLKLACEAVLVLLCYISLIGFLLCPVVVFLVTILSCGTCPPGMLTWMWGVLAAGIVIPVACCQCCVGKSPRSATVSQPIKLLRYYSTMLRLRRWQNHHLLPRLQPNLPHFKRLVVVYNQAAGAVVQPSQLSRLLAGCTNLEAFTCDQQGGELAVFEGHGTTAAERRASLLPQLAAMHPNAPLLHPATWATHSCLTEAKCYYPSPERHPGSLPAALATTSLRSLHINFLNSVTWYDAAFATSLAALPTSLTHLALSCSISKAPSSLQWRPSPSLPMLQQLQLLVVYQHPDMDDEYLVQLASPWTHLTQLTRLHIQGLPWGPFRSLPRLRHLTASGYTCPSPPDLRHQAAHLQHLSLSSGLTLDGTALRLLTTLTHLELIGTPAAPELLCALNDLPKLETLHLDPGTAEGHDAPAEGQGAEAV